MISAWLSVQISHYPKRWRDNLIKLELDYSLPLDKLKYDWEIQVMQPPSHETLTMESKRISILLNQNLKVYDNKSQKPSISKDITESLK